MIAIERLAMRFPNEREIAYSDMTFESGASYVILGASGSGKSTLLNMISGVLTPSRGRVVIDGRDMTALPIGKRDAYRVKHIGCVFQDFKLIEEMTVEDNIRILEMERVDVSGLRAMLDTLGIGAMRKRRVMNLSGGEKQRVAIARALIKNPSIVLADEPTGNLNFEIGLEVTRMLTEAARGRTVIAVTHDDRLADLFDHRIDMSALLMASREEARAYV